ncbi:MAG: MBL fold metallo-hydrolase [Deltaproteobacteria bacterium]|nr:MBL fold metallo-hydrolase [Deltaproteobacteria bacterium]
MFEFKKGCIRFIRGGKYPQCHSVFIDDKLRALIDPACDKKVLKTIHSEKPIEVIINSHCHEDHFLNNYLFPKAQLWVPEQEANLFRSAEALLDYLLEPEDKNDPNNQISCKYLYDVYNFREREPERLLRDGDIIDFGETRMEVLHTPGHSEGHLSFYFPEDRVLFTADLDLVKAGPYYGDKGSDVDDVISSLKRLIKIDADTYLSAHGKIGVYEGDPQYIQDYLDTVYDRENKLLYFLKSGPKTLQEITDQGIIYGDRTVIGNWNLKKSEKAMMKKHLIRLGRMEKIRNENGHYILNV